MRWWVIGGWVIDDEDEDDVYIETWMSGCLEKCKKDETQNMHFRGNVNPD